MTDDVRRDWDKPGYDNPATGRPFIMPKAKHANGSTVIQQIGLDTPMGVQRLLMLLLSKLDPQGNGVTISLDDINHAVATTAPPPLGVGKANMLIRGENDELLLKLVDDAEWVEWQAKEKK